MKRIRLTFLLMVSFFLSLPAVAQVAQPVDIRDVNIADEADDLPVSDTTLQGYVDQLEGYVDQLEGYVDGLETLLNGGLPAALAAQGGLKIEGVASGTAVTVSPETAEAAVDDAVSTDPVQVGGTYEASHTVIEDDDAGVLHLTTDQLLKIAVTASAEGGADFHSFITTASANLTNVKASAGVVKTIILVNPHDSLHYFKMYNKASAPDPSACSANSDCGVIYLPIPAHSSELGGGFVVPLPPEGIEFDTGIGYSVTGAACTVLSTCTDETNTEAGIAIFMTYQ